MKIVCIGAGRLAHHLMPALQHAGCAIVQVYNRTHWPSVLLAQKLNAASHITTLSEIDRTADLYFLSVSDDAILEIADELKDIHDLNGIVVHCSGVLGLDILPFEKQGVFYPLQTFSEHHEVEWKQTPVIVTADNAEILEILKTLAGKISDAVYPMDDHQKSIIHLSAVFANNFTNHMMSLAESICNENNVSFDILKPLLRTTMEKALTLGPSNSQTGPAIRGDETTIAKHLTLLENHPELREIYKMITLSIIQG